MATRKGILETKLCASVAEKAIKNAGSWINGYADPQSEASFIIFVAFSWRKSPEGYDYWQEIHEQLEENNL